MQHRHTGQHLVRLSAQLAENSSGRRFILRLADLLPVEVDQRIASQHHRRRKAVYYRSGLTLGQTERFFQWRPLRFGLLIRCRRHHEERRLKQSQNLIAARRGGSKDQNQAWGYPVSLSTRSTSTELVVRNMRERASAAPGKPLQYHPRCLRMAEKRQPPPRLSKYRACSTATRKRSPRGTSGIDDGEAASCSCAFAHCF